MQCIVIPLIYLGIIISFSLLLLCGLYNHLRWGGGDDLINTLNCDPMRYDFYYVRMKIKREKETYRELVIFKNNQHVLHPSENSKLVLKYGTYMIKPLLICI